MRTFFTNKQIVILAGIMIVGILLGRLTVRVILNALLGGSLLGGISYKQWREAHIAGAICLQGSVFATENQLLSPIRICVIIMI